MQKSTLKRLIIVFVVIPSIALLIVAAFFGVATFGYGTTGELLLYLVIGLAALDFIGIAVFALVGLGPKEIYRIWQANTKVD